MFPILMTSFSLNYLPKALSSNIVTGDIRVSKYEFWGDTIQFIEEAK